MRFSRTRLADVLHRRHSASPVPRLMGARRDDDSVEVDQPEAVRGLAGGDPPPRTPGTLGGGGGEKRPTGGGGGGELVGEMGGGFRGGGARPPRPETGEGLG